MTNEYKENILKYITGNLESQYGIYDPQFKDIDSETNNLQTQIESYFDSIVIITDFIASKDNKNQNLDYSVVVCYGTLKGRSDTSSAFVILDENYNIVQFISKYSDNQYFGIIECINLDEKGNFYCVERKNNNLYIVELNNIVLKLENQSQFKVTKVKSYLLLSDLLNRYTTLKIFRNSSSQRYFVLSNYEVNGDTTLRGISKNVSDAEEVSTIYTSEYSKSNALSLFDNGVNVYWDSNNDLHFNIAVTSNGLHMLTNDSTTTMVDTRITYDENDISTYSNFIFYSNTIGYYATLIDNDPITTFKIYKVNLVNKTATEIYSQSSTYNSRNIMWLFKNNNGIYFEKGAYNGVDYDLTFGLIFGVSVYETNLGTFTANSFLEAFCYPNVANFFNKNYVYIQNQDTLFSLNFDWNDANYNGLPFISYGSLVPNTVGIDDENENEVFNRNLYNLSNYSNRYTASVQIPNYSLNSDQLYTAILYSKNLNILSNKTINTIKNVYEELYINFINIFNIIDGETNIINYDGSANLVSLMLNSVVDANLNKFVINYHDGTSEIKALVNNGINNLKSTISLVVYTKKQIDSIDLISDNELITYHTIDCSNLELDKYYKINIDVRIE